jgi:transcription initiation factor TFIIIB Brf1 subunit/transcription initiation factor TFIIB
MSCTHSSVIEDEREGTVVCLACCRVIDQLYVSFAVSNPTLSNPLSKYDSIENICANFHIPESVKQSCISIFERVKRVKGTRKFSNSALIAYAIYNGLLEHTIARSPQEILFMTGVDLTQIMAIEKVLSTPVICPSSSTYLERYAVQCGLGFKDVQQMYHYYEYVNELCENYASQTIAAAIIAHYCKLNKKALTVKKIANVCMVSSSSLYRIIKKINSN